MTQQNDITESLTTLAMNYETDSDGLEPTEAEVETPVADVTETPEAPVEETPPTPDPEPPKPTPLSDPERQQFEELKQAQRETAIRQAVNQIDQEAAKIRAEKLAQYGDVVADEFANMHKNLRQRELQATLLANETQENDRVKREYAESIGKEFGVDPTRLISSQTLTAMRERAQDLREIAALTKEAKALRPKAKAQQLEGNATEQGAGMNDDAKRIAIGNGDMDTSTMSVEELERLVNTA